MQSDMAPIHAIVLCAGRGTRMQSKKPKVLHQIAGAPMLRYVLSNVDSLQPARVSVVVAPGMDDVEREVKALDKKFQCVVQKKPLGSGDAAKCGIKAAPKSAKTEVTLVLFGDTPFVSPDTLMAMIEEISQDDENAVCVLGFTPEDPAEYGRLLIDNAGKLRAIVEYKDASDEEREIGICNAGAMAIRTQYAEKFIDQIKPNNAKKEYYLTDIVSIARKAGCTCSVIEAHEYEVMGINTKQQLAEAEGIMQNFLRNEAMGQGATLLAPETVFLQHDTQLGADSIIHPHVIFGPGVTVEQNAVIHSFSHISEAKVKAGATVGPFARIRPGTVIHEEAHIGNFVEVKNSEIRRGAKIGHLTYIGDSDIGKNVNIGAGTVTCNYDGKKKHKTTIAEGAFIGSNTSLIAPLTIGKGAMIGAGATVTKNVKAGSKVINHMPQVEL